MTAKAKLLTTGHTASVRESRGAPEQARQSPDETAPLNVRWLIHPLTASDVVLFLESVQASLEDVAYNILVREGLPEPKLKAWRQRSGLVELEIIEARSGSFEFKFECKWRKDPKSDPLIKQIAKGVLKKVLIAWISSVILLGRQQAPAPAKPNVAPEVRDSAVTLVENLGRTGKRSSLAIVDPDTGKHRFPVLIRPIKAM